MVAEISNDVQQTRKVGKLFNSHSQTGPTHSFDGRDAIHGAGLHRERSPVEPGRISIKRRFASRKEERDDLKEPSKFE